MTQILEETSETSCLNYLSKLKFLQSEKERLQLAISQLQYNNRLLRYVNESISKNNQFLNQQIMTTLSNQNKQLQQNYFRILQQNERLASSLLLQQQIIDENEQQHINILRMYEQKIIELRRSIQMKEGYIQNLEEKVKNTDDRMITPATNVNLLFFQEIQDLKRVIATLTAKNSKLQEDSRQITLKNQEIQTKLHLMEILTTKSKLMFQEFKRHYYQQKKHVSAPKRGVNLPIYFDKINVTNYKKMSEAETRVTQQFSECSTLVIKDSSLKMLVYKGALQNHKLRQQIEKIKISLKYVQNLKKVLTQSYKKKQKNMEILNEEVNYFKKATRDLLRVMTHRRQQLRSSSLQKTKEEKVIKSIKQPEQTAGITQRRTYWNSIQQKIKIEKYTIQPKSRRWRSLSCVLDYRTRQSDDKQQFHKIAKKEKANLKQRQSDFSMMMTGQIEVDVSIIQPAANKHTYAEWKLSGEIRKKQAILGTTLMEESIF